MKFLRRLFRDEESHKLEEKLECANKENLMKAEKSHRDSLEAAEKVNDLNHTMQVMVDSLANRRKNERTS